MIRSILRRFYSTPVILSHTGEIKMVNVSHKSETLRYARASCSVFVKKEVINFIKDNKNEKGDVLRTSEIAGIMAAKKTSDLIPLCHQLNLNSANIKIELIEPALESSTGTIYIESMVESQSKTGVEMEAMLAATVSALTIYDMCKSADKDIVISDVKLLEKFGGKSGHYINKNTRI
jgi:molybdenum cofactor biosynthesis protein MoaC